jgi:lysophospholipase L1-like esterase
MSRQVKVVCFLSIALNVFFLIRAFRQEQNSSSRTQNLSEKPISHFLVRDKIFKILPNDADEIIMMGTSLTQNMEWNEFFRDLHIKNRGINGETTQGVIERLDEVIESHPKKIFLEIGINDLLHNTPESTIIFNIKKIIRTIRLQSPATIIYLQSILPTDWNIYEINVPVISRIHTLNNAIKLLVAENVIYIDLASKFILNNKMNPEFDSGDHLHLSGSGYKLWCEQIKKYLL